MSRKRLMSGFADQVACGAAGHTFAVAASFAAPPKLRAPARDDVAPAGDDVAAGRDEVPAARDEAPAAHDEVPAARDEAPPATNDVPSD